jgi:hypothetical protein
MTPSTTHDDRVVQLEAEVAELKALVRDLAKEHRQPTRTTEAAGTEASSSEIDATDGDRTTSRRRMLRLVGAAAVGSVAAGAASGRAAAVDGISLILGGPNSTAAGTYIEYTGSSTTTSAFVFADDAYSSTAISFYPSILGGWAGTTNQPNGIYGYTTDAAGNAVVAFNDATVSGDGAALLARSDNGTAIRANGVTSSIIANSSGTTSTAIQATGGSTGVTGTGDLDPGSSGTGVLGLGETGVSGWAATGGNGYGLSAVFSGRASLWLRTTNTFFGELLKSPPPSRTNEHAAGEVETDSNGDLWYCFAGGTPGSWRKLAGAGTAGSFHAVTPFRVYDSRAPQPAQGQITAGQNRTISVADSRDITTGVVVTANAVPAGATAIACNLTVVNTANGGFLTVNPGGVVTVGAASVNWSASGQVLNNGIIAAINAATRQVTVVCGAGTTDFVLDVTGYYR